jgi:hypothetical protein
MQSALAFEGVVSGSRSFSGAPAGGLTKLAQNEPNHAYHRAQ